MNRCLDHILQHTYMGKNVKSLENHSNMLPQLMQCLTGIHRFSHIIDFAAVVGFQLVDTPENCGFTRTAGTKDCNLFPFMYVKTDFLQHLKIPKAFADIFYT